MLVNTDIVVVFPISDPGALRLYSFSSIIEALSGPNSIPFVSRPPFGAYAQETEFSCKARGHLLDGAVEFTVEGVMFVRRSVR
jgi:hypothetical protein